MATKLRGRPAHAPGPTYLSYTPNGKKLITAGLNGAVRIFEHDSDDEPAIIDVTTENHFAVAAGNDFCLIGAEDGSVTKYSLLTREMEEILLRCSMPVRDIALSPDGMWAAVASDDLEVRIVNTMDMTRVFYLRDQPRPAKHVSWDVGGTTLAVSCTDGVVYVYSISSEQPQLLKRVDGLVKTMESDSESSAAVYWHPDGRAFAAPTATRDFQVVARSDWSFQKAFKSGHSGDITAAAWSPNGAFLVTAGADRSLTLWDARSQKVLKRHDDVQNVTLEMQWHPKDNVLSYTNNNGELFIREDFVPDALKKLLRMELQPAPFNNEETSGGAQRGLQTNGANGDGFGVRTSREEPDIDDILDDAISEDGGAFIEDDDGAGYAEELNDSGKRPANGVRGPAPKRHAPQAVWQPQIHESFQPGSTPWKGNRRYLCLNLTGFVWTVDQEAHHTVTVEFYDRYAHRDFHFTDPYLYDKACLNDKGALFSCPPSTRYPALLYYRPHETWTARPDWRVELPRGEKVTAISLSSTSIVATTSAGYVRVYSLFGLPLKVYRQKSTPAVTCTSWRDYVLTVGNGPVGGDGKTRLLYSIENHKRDETCQSEDILPLPSGPDSELRSVFFSDSGDPCIYDSEGVLLILTHWRTPGQAQWIPLLDTRNLARLASGKKDETYWPVAVAEDKFHCIILKGGEEYPYFPRPLLTDFDFNIPISNPNSKDDDDDFEIENSSSSQQRDLEQKHVLLNTQLSLLSDRLEHTNATSAQKAELPQLEREVDKVLLQLFAHECGEGGEERGMKALEIASLMRDRTGKMLEACGKVAQRYKLQVLGEKVLALGERRLVGLNDDEEDL
ncbi:hypothetical protein MBLNU230_g7642t1 [Neophaeotheca triangularis]